MSRMLLIAAFMAAPIVMIPSQADAQQRGSDRARAATVNGNPGAETTSKGRETAPEGLRRAWEGRTPPPALQRRFPGLATQTVPEPPSEPGDDCPTTFVLAPDGTLVEVDCHGIVIGAD